MLASDVGEGRDMFGNSILRRAGALPKEPTAAPPGSEEKIRIMTERAARREQLFHPLDGPGYRGRPPDPPEDPEDWPFELAGSQAELPIPEDVEDFDEEDEELGVPAAPALCSWTEPVRPPELAGVPIATGEPPALPADPRFRGEPEATALKAGDYEPDRESTTKDSMARW